MVTRLTQLLLLFAAFIPLLTCAQVPSTDTKDYQIARKRLYVGTGDTSLYFTGISLLLDSTVTHKHIPSARAVVEYINANRPLVYEVGLVSPLPGQPVPAGSVALKKVDVNDNQAVYFSNGTDWIYGGEFGGIGNVDSLMLGPGEVKAVHLGQNNADVGDVMKWNGTAWEAQPDSAAAAVSIPAILDSLMLAGGTYRIDTFHTPGDHEWIKPAWATSVYVVVIGAGGGGASGGVQATGVVARAGSGGGAGGRSERLFPASIVSDTVTISVAAGGTGGAAISTNSTSGATGSSPTGTSAFGPYLRAFNGTNGTATNGGTGGGGNFGSGSGGASSSPTGSGVAPSASLAASLGGISSPGITGANTGGTGLASNHSFTYFNIGNLTACAGGTPGCTDDGGDAVVNHLVYLSTGGGGGRSTPTANGGRGGDAYLYGGGGAGGAGARNGFTSGRGGRGGDGFVAVISFSGASFSTSGGSDSSCTSQLVGQFCGNLDGNPSVLKYVTPPFDTVTHFSNGCYPDWEPADLDADYFAIDTCDGLTWAYPFYWYHSGGDYYWEPAYDESFWIPDITPDPVTGPFYVLDTMFDNSIGYTWEWNSATDSWEYFSGVIKPDFSVDSLSGPFLAQDTCSNQYWRYDLPTRDWVTLPEAYFTGSLSDNYLPKKSASGPNTLVNSSVHEGVEPNYGDGNMVNRVTVDGWIQTAPSWDHMLASSGFISNWYTTRAKHFSALASGFYVTAGGGFGFVTAGQDRFSLAPNGDIGFGVNIFATNPATTDQPAQAKFEVRSSTQGALLPRLTTTQRDAIAGTKPAGLELYCTDCTATDGSTGVKQCWNGSSWKNCW